MYGEKNQFLVFALLAALLFQDALVLQVFCCNRPGNPCPTPSPGPPSYGGGGGGYGKQPPSRGGGGGGGCWKPPPSRGGGGGSCGKPPPSRGPPPRRGGGYYSPPPPSRGPPSRRGGGYYSPPTTPIINPPPLVPVTPTPIINPPTPVPTPTIPWIPPTPGFTPTPTIPIFDPNIHPCDFWRTHPALIWGIFGFWGTIGGLFGMPVIPFFGGDPTILQALASPRTDGYGALLREGSASLLNSLASKKFPFTTQQVKDDFTSSLVSEMRAANQAQRFKMANEGRLNKIN